MSTAPKNGSKKSTWLRLTGTLLALALLIYLLSEQGWQEIWLAIQQIALWQLVLALAFTFGSRLAVCARWHVLLRSADTQITFSQTSRLTFAGLFASNFLPTTIGGDVVRLAGAIQMGYDGAVGTASLVVDRLVGMAGMAMALPFGLPAFKEVLDQRTGSSALVPLNTAVGLASSSRSQSRIKKWQGVLLGFGDRLLQALSLWLRQPRSLLAALGYTWLHMLSLFASIWLLLEGMNDPMPFWLIAGLWSAVYFITLLPISINGYGLQEVSLAFIFTRVGGISASSALTLAILVRTLTMLASLPGALFVPGIMAGRKESDNNPVPIMVEQQIDKSAVPPPPAANPPPPEG
jgi:uncharacterized membrane protein YbhN (UPF0104 family)